jgi:hypothetical protein
MSIISRRPKSKTLGGKTMHNPIVTAPIINRLRNSTKRHVVLEHARGDPGKIEPLLGAQVRTLRYASCG